MFPKFKIAILEDDDCYNKLLCNFLLKKLNEVALIKGFRIEVKSFLNFEEFVKNFSGSTVLLFTDYYLDNKSCANHVIQFVKNKTTKCKIVVLSQLQNLSTSYLTLQNGAFDFIKKDAAAFENCKEVVLHVINNQSSYN